MWLSSRRGLMWPTVVVVVLVAFSSVDNVQVNGQDLHMDKQHRLLKRQLPELFNLSTCGVNCLVQSVVAFGCDVTNTTCSCASPQVSQLAMSCLNANCTMLDSLDAAKLQASLCNLPHESQTSKLLGLMVTVYVMAAIAILLRLIAKGSVKTWTLDDALIISAMVIAIAPFSFIMLMATKGFGKHVYDLGPGDLSDVLQLLYASEIVYIFVLLFSKLSLAVFYLQIFTLSRFRTATYTLIGFLVIGQLIVGFITIFACHPVELFWNKDLIHHPTTSAAAGCLDINELAYANSSLAIVQDLILLALPIANLPGQEMNRKTKLYVAGILFLGSFAVISTIIRLQVLAVFGNSPDDLPWGYAPVMWWTTIELGIVIVCACLPMIRKLLDRVSPCVELFLRRRWTVGTRTLNTPATTSTSTNNNTIVTSPKPSKNSGLRSSTMTTTTTTTTTATMMDDRSFKLGRYQNFRNHHISPPQLSDNYVRDYIGNLSSPTKAATVTAGGGGADVSSAKYYREMYAYGGSKPKVLESPATPPPQPYDLSWRSTNPYGIPMVGNAYAVGKTNYNLDLEMLERKERNFYGEHPELMYYGRAMTTRGDHAISPISERCSHCGRRRCDDDV